MNSLGEAVRYRHWLPAVALVAFFACGVQGFVRNPKLGAVGRSFTSTGLLRQTGLGRPGSSQQVLMAGEGGGKKKKKRRRKESDNAPPVSDPVLKALEGKDMTERAIPDIDFSDIELEDNPEFIHDKSVEKYFTNDWSGMPEPEGMPQPASKLRLPDYDEFLARKRAKMAGTPEKSTSQDVPDLSNFESKLTPLSDGPKPRERSAAEDFKEGPLVKGLKTATWFSICALVAWEVYINSPLFHTPSPPILS